MSLEPDPARAGHSRQAPGPTGRPSAGWAKPPAWLTHRAGHLLDWVFGARRIEAAIIPADADGPTSATKLGDFTTDGRLVYISVLALGVGVLCALIAVALMDLIGLITNAAYYHRFSFKLVSPSAN